MFLQGSYKVEMGQKIIYVAEKNKIGSQQNYID